MIDKKIAFRAAFQKKSSSSFSRTKIPSPILSANFGTQRKPTDCRCGIKMCGKIVASPIQYINPGTFWGEFFGDSCFLDFIFWVPQICDRLVDEHLNFHHLQPLGGRAAVLPRVAATKVLAAEIWRFFSRRAPCVFHHGEALKRWLFKNTIKD